MQRISARLPAVRLFLCPARNFAPGSSRKGRFVIQSIVRKHCVMISSDDKGEPHAAAQQRELSEVEKSDSGPALCQAESHAAGSRFCHGRSGADSGRGRQRQNDGSHPPHRQSAAVRYGVLPYRRYAPAVGGEMASTGAVRRRRQLSGTGGCAARARGTRPMEYPCHHLHQQGSRGAAHAAGRHAGHQGRGGPRGHLSRGLFPYPAQRD